MKAEMVSAGLRLLDVEEHERMEKEGTQVQATLPPALSWRQLLILTGVIGVLHIYSFHVFGATFWYDGIIYATMGYEISHNSLASFYTGDRLTIMMHVGPGMGWIWALCTRMCGENAWVALAAAQHILAVVALVYFLSAMRALLSFVWILGLGIVLSLHPFLRSFDNALMTESLCGSCVLVAVGAALRIASGGRLKGNTGVLLAAVFVSTQVRCYYYLFGLALIGILGLWWFRRLGFLSSLRRFAPAALLIMAGYLFFPALRWVKMGEWCVSDGSIFLLAHALDLTPHPSPGLARDLRAYDLPPHFDPEVIARKPFNYTPWNELAQAMLARGDSLHEVNATFRRMAWRVRTDSRESIENHLAHACFAVGFTRLDLFFSRDHIPARSTPSVQQLREHNTAHYLWLARVYLADYSAEFENFVTRYHEQPTWYTSTAIDEYARCIRPHLRRIRPRLCDPLCLTAVPVEVWLAGALLGFVLLPRRHKILGCLLLCSLPVNFIVMSLSGLGSYRYFYPLIPLYFASSCVAVAFVTQWGATSLQKRGATWRQATKEFSVN
jgi:hypothetical protein